MSDRKLIGKTATDMTDMDVEVRGVSKWFGDTQILHDVELTVEPGEVVSIIGPSGSGKSTLLRCVNALEPYQAGEIRVRGERVGQDEFGRPLLDNKLAHQRSHVGMVFQRFNLFSHLTALENVSIGPRMVLKHSKTRAAQNALGLLDQVGLADKARSYPSQLSGGQQQRVAIARALAMSPSVMLFDEPTSALDPELVGEVLKVMKDLAAAGLTMLVVTHEIDFARDVADRTIAMDRGCIIENGPSNEVIGSPRHPRTREFLQRVLHPERSAP